MTDTDHDNSDEIAKLVRLLKVFFLIVLTNITLYITMVFFAVVLFHRSLPTFIAFIQFLALILPIAFMLRLGLKETPIVGAVENPFLKTVGATPSLVILSGFVSLLATFTPLSDQIFPKADTLPSSLVTKVGVACRILKDQNPATGAYLLSVISGDDPDDIRTIRNDLKTVQAAASNVLPGDASKPITVYGIAEIAVKQLLQAIGLLGAAKATDREEPYSDLKLVEKSDKFYNLLKQNGSISEDDTDLRRSLSDDHLWIAFTVPIKRPDDYTNFPIHTRFGTMVHTKVFLLSVPDNAATANISGDPLTAAAPARLRGTQSPVLIARKISEVELRPRRPDSEPQGADLNINIFPTNTCWKISPNEMAEAR